LPRDFATAQAKPAIDVVKVRIQKNKGYQITQKISRGRFFS
jgi:hypothetical protein